MLLSPPAAPFVRTLHLAARVRGVAVVPRVGVVLVIEDDGPGR
jgi:hypothetical protein